MPPAGPAPSVRVTWVINRRCLGCPQALSADSDEGQRGSPRDGLARPRGGRQEAEAGPVCVHILAWALQERCLDQLRARTPTSSLGWWGQRKPRVGKRSWLRYRGPLRAKCLVGPATAARQKWHGMCWGCACVRELASKGQLPRERGVRLSGVHGDKPEWGSWALAFRQLRAMHAESGTERGTGRLRMTTPEVCGSFVWPESIKPPCSAPFCEENQS